MGMVYVTAEIGPDWEHLAPVRFLVDTGVLYTCVSPQMAEELGLSLTVPTRLVTAGNQFQEVLIGVALMRVAGRENGIAVAGMEVPVPLLGSTSLQSLGLKVNPVDEVLEHYGVYPPKV